MRVLTIEAWSKGNDKEANAKDSGERIATKVNLAQHQLKKDFSL